MQFATLMPMRTIPFRVVCLLGMHDGAYPRPGQPRDFDLMARPGEYRAGDRSRREDDRYLISDPVMENVTSLSRYELERVRFAKGALSPRGQLYYPKEKRVVTDDQVRAAIKTGIKRNVRDMIYIPGNIAGVRGIAYTGRKIKKWRDKLGPEKAGLYLAQLVRMQEEIGTGGGGFRYIYGAFLQEAHAYLPYDEFLSVSKKITDAGDRWRNAAVQAAGIYKGRIGSQADFDVMGDQLIEISGIEKEAFRELSNIKWK